MKQAKLVPLANYVAYPEDEMKERIASLRDLSKRDERFAISPTVLFRAK